MMRKSKPQLRRLCAKVAFDLILIDGNEYTGNFVQNQMHGQGTMHFAGGDVYVGAWKEGQASGQGVYTFKDGETVTGSFALGVSSGRCTVRYRNGDIYVGNMEDDERHGRGTLTVAGHDDPDKPAGAYDGTWSKGKRDGAFFYTRAGGASSENQTWKDGKRVS